MQLSGLDENAQLPSDPFDSWAFLQFQAPIAHVLDTFGSYFCYK
jgi:hypothetical protein